MINLGSMDNHNIEVGVIREDKKFHVLTPTEIKEYLDELQWLVMNEWSMSWFENAVCLLTSLQDFILFQSLNL